MRPRICLPIKKGTVSFILPSKGLTKVLSFTLFGILIKKQKVKGAKRYNSSNKMDLIMLRIEKLCL